MATLYVENIPEDLYDSLRSRAQANRSSIAAEVIGLLAEHIATPAEIDRRKSLIAKLGTLQSRNSAAATAAAAASASSSTEDLLRQDRSR